VIVPTSFRLKNIRCLQDSGDIELKPINILVGKNSSGKSTFARIFPLLRQSAEASKRGPLLWWGRLVDFGSFDETVSRSAKEKTIGLNFKASFQANDLSATVRRAYGRLSMLRTIQDGDLNVEMVFSLSNAGDTYTSEVSIRLFDFDVKIHIGNDGFISSIVCGTFKWAPSSTSVCYAPQNSLIPTPTFFKSKEVNQETGTWEQHDPIGLELQRSIRPLVHGNTTEERIRQLAARIPLGSRDTIFNTLTRTSNPQSFSDNLKYYGINSNSFRRLCDYSFVFQIETIIEKINHALSSFSNDVIYLEPLRATAQRYYRQQALAVEEIDSKGENIAMFLDSLPYQSKKSFQEWTKIHFGIVVSTRKEGGHISITIRPAEGGPETNMADMGFGFSQVIPIAAQLWAASEETQISKIKRQRVSQPLIVIEQPELHLHPEYQARLADVFNAAVTQKTSAYTPDEKNKTKKQIRIIAETHSPHLINRLGTLISEGKLDPRLVQVIVFDQKSHMTPTSIQIANYNDEGILENWPLGFFDSI
jgi:hypothetical protein